MDNRAVRGRSVPDASVQPTVTVDATPPDPTLTGPSSAVTSTAATFAFTSSEAASTFQY